MTEAISTPLYLPTKGTQKEIYNLDEMCSEKTCRVASFVKQDLGYLIEHKRSLEKTSSLLSTLGVFTS